MDSIEEMEKINVANLKVWQILKQNYEIKSGFKLVRPQIDTILFSSKEQKLDFIVKPVEKTYQDLSTCFNGAQIIFHDKLPSTEYLDLSGLVQKLKLLNPASNQFPAIVQSWKTAFNKVQKYLEQLLKECKEENALAKRVDDFFGVDVASWQHYTVKPTDPSFDISIQFSMGMKDLDKLKKIIPAISRSIQIFES